MKKEGAVSVLLFHITTKLDDPDGISVTQSPLGEQSLNLLDDTQ